MVMTKTVNSLHEEVANFHEISTKQKDEVLVQLSKERETLQHQMLQIDLKLSEQLKLTSKIEPLVEEHDSKIKDLSQMITGVQAKQILNCEHQIQQLLSLKLDSLTHEEDFYKLKNELHDTQDTSANFKTHFMRVENFIQKYLPI